MESMKETIANLSEVFHSKLSEFEKGGSPASLSTEFSNFKTFILSALNLLQRQVDFLMRDVDRLEMARRRKMLLVHGLPEEKSEDTSARITSLVAEHLNLENFSSSCIMKSYRLGRSIGKKPRPIVIKFADIGVRDRVWFAKTKLKGTGLTQSEFLTKTRHQVFLEARRRFGINSCWTRDGFIHILSADGQRHKAECMLDLDSIPSSESIPSSASQKSPAHEKNLTSKANEVKVTVPRAKRVLKK